jgi:hypothetical protein
MSRINTSKVIVGGLLAGLVFNIGDFVINTIILAEDFRAGMAMLGLDPAVMESGSTIACWVIIDFLFGLLVVWNYAAIRPRFGPGPMIAILAALPAWAGASLVVFGFASMGIFAMPVAWKGAILSGINTAIGSMAGAWVYSET